MKMQSTQNGKKTILKKKNEKFLFPDFKSDKTKTTKNYSIQGHLVLAKG